MALVLGDLVEVKYVCTSQPAGQNLSVSYNTVHYVIGQVLGAGMTEQQLADAISGRVAAFYLPLMHVNALYHGVLLKKINPPPQGDTFISIIGNGPGVVAGDQLPMQTCGMLSKFTGMSGVKNRGRNYIPYPAELSNGGDQRPTLAYTTDLASLGTTIYNGFTYGAPPDQIQLTSVLFHGLTAPVIFNFITAFSARKYWTNQRRRMNPFKSDPLPPV